MKAPGKKITLEAWAAANFDPPPSKQSLWRMARECHIFPAPVKVGRTYYVEPDARYVGKNYVTSVA